MNDQYLLPQDELFLPATMPAVFFSYHVLPDGSVRVLSADNRIREIFGYAPEIFAQDAAIIFSLIHADDVARVREAIAESVQTVLPWHSEFRIQHPEQGEIWVEVQSAPQREQDGSMRWCGFVTNISKRKKNEALLQQSEKRYTAIVNAIHDAIILHDLEGKVLDVNQAMLSLFGITREEALKTTIAQDLSGPGNPIETMPALWDRVVHGEKITFEWNARRPKDGATFLVEVRLQRITLENQALILSTVRDITEQKQAEKTLRSSEARFKGLTENLPGVVYQFYVRTNGDMGMYYFSKLSVPLFGLDVSNLDTVFQQFVDHVAPEDRERFVASIAQAVQSFGGWDFEGRYIKTGGVELYFRGISKPRRLENEIVFDGVLLDITERKQAERKLQQLADLHQTILDTITTGLIFVKNRRKQWANAAFCTMFGYAPDEVVDVDVAMLYAHDEDYRQSGIEAYPQLARGETHSREVQMKRKDGSLFWCHIAGKAVNPENPFEASVWVLQDITERKRAEAALENNLLLYEQLVVSVPMGIFRIRSDDDGFAFVYVSDRFCELIGASREPILADAEATYTSIVPEERAEFISRSNEALRNGLPFRWEGRTRIQGQTRCLHIESRPAPDGKGGFVWTGFVLDITEQKQLELELHANEERLWGIALNIPGMVFQFFSRSNGDVGLNYVSDRCMEYLGLDNSCLEGLFERFVAGIAEEDQAPFLDSIRTAVASVAPWEFEGKYIKPDGERIYFRGISQPQQLEHELVFNGLILDITERKQAEEKFGQLAALHQTILDTVTPSLAFVQNRRQQWANAAFFKIFGYDASEVKDVETFQLYADLRDYEQVGIEAYPRLAHGDVYSKELQLKRKDGSIFWSNMVGKAVNPENISDGTIWMVQDITERKKAEDELITSQSLLRDSQRVAHIGCWNLDIQEKRLFWNEEAYEIHGFHPGEIQPTFDDFMAMVHPDDRGILLPHFQECVETGQFRDFECRIVQPDGAERVIYVAGKVAIDESGKPYRTFGIVQDITERKKAEEDKALLEAQLLQAQKMESVGRLAGGVAHDFNNMLGVILGCVDLMQSELTRGHPLMQYVLEIEKAATRSADITRQLLAFSRKQVITLKSIDLNAVIAATSKTLGRLIGEDIELCFQPCAALWKIKFDPSQIDQILINLAVNARDAMPRGGILNITTENLSLDEAYCRENIQCMPGEYVMLAVSDNGTGMDKETLTHIFEPFFTTKGVGMGTGLGLATIYGIVNQNAGSINVYSELGHGSTFKIYIPRNMEEEAPEEMLAVMPLPQGAGSILLVEDDEMVRATTRIILREIGYTVLVAENAFEALLLCEKKDTHIDLLITDVIMPGMNGKDLRDKIESMRPGIKSLFMSGYPADIIAHSGVLEQGINFIQKPFNKNDLARKVSDIIRAG